MWLYHASQNLNGKLSKERFMKCCRCGLGITESKRNYYPIDPKGTKNRRWVCHICMTPEERDKVPADVRKIVGIIKGTYK